MAYPKLCEGNAPFTAGSGNNAGSAAMNETINQLKAMLGPRDIVLPVSGAQAGSGDWAFYETNNPPRWADSTVNGGLLRIDLPVHSGMYIDEVKLLLGGLAEVGETNEGSIIIYRGSVADSFTKDVAAELDSADPWVLGAAGPKLVTFTSVDLEILEEYIYWLELESNDGGAGDECYYYGGILHQAQLDQ